MYFIQEYVRITLSLTFMLLCIVNILGTANKMQRFTIFFIIVNAVHVSGRFSAHHWDATASGGSKQAWHVQFLSS
jgi:hypothetical protein